MMLVVGGWVIGAHAGTLFRVGHVGGQYCILRTDTMTKLKN